MMQGKVRPLSRDGKTLPRQAIGIPNALSRQSDMRTVRRHRDFLPVRLQDHVCVVISGLFIARYEREPGLRVSELLLPGDVVADGVLGASPPGTLVAATAGRVVAVDLARACQLTTSDQDATQWLLKGMAIRAQRAENRQTNLMRADIRTRLAGFLLDWSDAIGGTRLPGPYNGGLTQRTIAEMIGATRAAVNRTLHGLERRGVVELGEGGITIVSFDGLRHAARSAEPILGGVQRLSEPCHVAHQRSSA